MDRNIRHPGTVLAPAQQGCGNCVYWNSLEKVKLDGVIDYLGTCGVNESWYKTGRYEWCSNHATTDELQNYLAELQVAANQL